MNRPWKALSMYVHDEFCPSCGRALEGSVARRPSIKSAYDFLREEHFKIQQSLLAWEFISVDGP